MTNLSARFFSLNNRKSLFQSYHVSETHKVCHFANIFLVECMVH